MRMTVVLMPSLAEQASLGYGMVVDPATAVIPGRIPLWQGDDFKRPAIGWAENVHVNEEGRLVADIELDDAYQDHAVPGLNWSPSTTGMTLWGASLFPVVRGHEDA
jgi:hypothetical protein